MRVESVSSLKHTKHSRPLQKIPREGTNIRAVYDLLMERRGLPIEVPLTVLTGNGKRIINDLTDFYGLDIRKLRSKCWVLAGEWIGRVYVDYIAEALANSDSKKEAQK